MIDIRAWLFQRQWYKLKDVECRVIDKDGVVLGVWEPTRHGGASGSPETLVTAPKEEETTGVAETRHGGASGRALCDRCKKAGQDYGGEGADEVGDWVKLGICGGCYKKLKPRGFKRIA